MSRSRLPVPPDVARLRSSVAAYRQSHPKRSRLPDGLWQEAVRLSREHGVATVARGAGVGYSSLKRRREAAVAVRAAEPAAASPFVELRVAEVFGSQICTSGSTEVELTDDRGIRLRARLGANGPPVSELSSLLAALWSRRR